MDTQGVRGRIHNHGTREVVAGEVDVRVWGKPEETDVDLEVEKHLPSSTTHLRWDTNGIERPPASPGDKQAGSQSYSEISDHLKEIKKDRLAREWFLRSSPSCLSWFSQAPRFPGYGLTSSPRGPSMDFLAPALLQHFTLHVFFLLRNWVSVSPMQTIGRSL